MSSLSKQAWTPRLITHVRIFDIFRRHVADDALAERLNDVFTFLERGRVEALNRTAVLLGHGHVLRHVDETSR